MPRIRRKHHGDDRRSETGLRENEMSEAENNLEEYAEDQGVGEMRDPQSTDDLDPASEAMRQPHQHRTHHGERREGSRREHKCYCGARRDLGLMRSGPWTGGVEQATPSPLAAGPPSGRAEGRGHAGGTDGDTCQRRHRPAHDAPAGPAPGRAPEGEHGLAESHLPDGAGRRAAHDGLAPGKPRPGLEIEQGLGRVMPGDAGAEKAGPENLTFL